MDAIKQAQVFLCRIGLDSGLVETILDYRDAYVSLTFSDDGITDDEAYSRGISILLRLNADADNALNITCVDSRLAYPAAEVTLSLVNDQGDASVNGRAATVNAALDVIRTHAMDLMMRASWVLKSQSLQTRTSLDDSEGK